MACSMIARRIDQKLHESMFSLGILHDVGIILMDQYVHEPFIEVLTQFDPKKDNLEILENEIIGFDHQKLAYTVMKDWGLPKEFLSTVANHHSPSSETDFPVVVSIVFLANALCNAANCGFVEGRRVNPNDFKTALDTLKLSKEDVQVLVEDLPHELERIDEFLGIL